MTDDTNDGFRPTRRSVLRLGAMSALGIGIGIPAVSGSVAATMCPKTPGYWANNPDYSSPTDNWAVLGPNGDTNYALRGVTMTHDEWREFLVAPTKGDKANIMAKHYLAIVLNLRNRPGDDPGCTSDGATIQYGDYAGYTIEEVKNMAGNWLGNSAWSNGGKQKSWYVSVGGDMVDGEPLKDTLDAFNNDPGSLGLDCPCNDR
ncbi:MULTISPECIES: Tat pathway signal protein [Haloferax]|jgi:hypothetical protein|uniref:Tat pathway signal protein n=1 Tax=Haloferax sp. Atlit-48N TaxID=2077198 RepID=A0ACD5HYC8_9EURY|nr:MULTISPECIES: Tat pathway signal protein [Haloferax]MBC9985679.1 Tat pathway signal protein [Haloferax sp. AS1]RDZ32942.1 Tat pathway signal protein [Haloferax sp. Atlit-48N]RDZ37372.1 Tat pathway signal protein [Haloferax sp. Atlit-24N]RDZ41129.1 Tat pathway signal protein [Haloferax sp. Atlit-47N]RLM38168.1 Tat pathway signal protein [Haloferax sp. Atlit-109R]